MFASLYDLHLSNTFVLLLNNTKALFNVCNIHNQLDIKLNVCYNNRQTTQQGDKMKLDISKYIESEVEKVKVTFAIDKKVLNEFKNNTKTLKINQSKLIEDILKDVNKQLAKQIDKITQPQTSN